MKSNVLSMKLHNMKKNPSTSEELNSSSMWKSRKHESKIWNVED
jgi:hypothetical protein